MDKQLKTRLLALLSRKFLIAFLSLAGATLLLALDKMESGAYVSVVGLIMGLFGAANAAVHLFDKKGPDDFGSA